MNAAHLPSLLAVVLERVVVGSIETIITDLEQCGTNLNEGRKPSPLSEEDAREWLESHAPAEVFEAHFEAKEA